MSGFFSRLAQLHSPKRARPIIPAQSPVFQASDSKETGQFESNPHHSDYSHMSNNENSSIDKSNTHESEDIDVKNNIRVNANKSNDIALPNTLEPIRDLVVKDELSPSNNLEMFGIDTIEESSSTLVPKTNDGVITSSQHESENRNSRVFDEATITPQKATVTKHGEMLRPINASVSAERIQSISNQKSYTKQSKNKSSQNARLQVDTDNQTVINVSIGQIDVRAISSDVSKSKNVTQKKRTNTQALEEYQQQRIRGNK